MNWNISDVSPVSCSEYLYLWSPVSRNTAGTCSGHQGFATKGYYYFLIHNFVLTNIFITRNMTDGAMASDQTDIFSTLWKDLEQEITRMVFKQMSGLPKIIILEVVRMAILCMTLPKGHPKMIILEVVRMAICMTLPKRAPKFK